MPKILFLKHKILLPDSISVSGNTGETILDIALRNDINIEHACGMSCACTTCHCIIKKGFNSLSKCLEKEEDALDKAWEVQMYSRLSCQAKLGQEDIVVEIPYYSINYVKE